MNSDSLLTLFNQDGKSSKEDDKQTQYKLKLEVIKLSSSSTIPLKPLFSDVEETNKYLSVLLIFCNEKLGLLQTLAGKMEKDVNTLDEMSLKSYNLLNKERLKQTKAKLLFQFYNSFQDSVKFVNDQKNEISKRIFFWAERDFACIGKLRDRVKLFYLYCFCFVLQFIGTRVKNEDRFFNYIKDNIIKLFDDQGVVISAPLPGNLKSDILPFFEKINDEQLERVTSILSSAYCYISNVVEKYDNMYDSFLPILKTLINAVSVLHSGKHDIETIIQKDTTYTFANKIVSFIDTLKPGSSFHEGLKFMKNINNSFYQKLISDKDERVRFFNVLIHGFLHISYIHDFESKFPLTIDNLYSTPFQVFSDIIKMAVSVPDHMYHIPPVFYTDIVNILIYLRDDHRVMNLKYLNSLLGKFYPLIKIDAPEYKKDFEMDALYGLNWYDFFVYQFYIILSFIRIYESNLLNAIKYELVQFEQELMRVYPKKLGNKITESDVNNFTAFYYLIQRRVDVLIAIYNLFVIKYNDMERLIIILIQQQIESDKGTKTTEEFSEFIRTNLLKHWGKFALIGLFSSWNGYYASEGQNPFNSLIFGYKNSKHSYHRIINPSFLKMIISNAGYFEFSWSIVKYNPNATMFNYYFYANDDVIKKRYAHYNLLNKVPLVLNIEENTEEYVGFYNEAIGIFPFYDKYCVNDPSIFSNFCSIMFSGASKLNIKTIYEHFGINFNEWAAHHCRNGLLMYTIFLVYFSRLVVLKMTYDKIENGENNLVKFMKDTMYSEIIKIFSSDDSSANFSSHLQNLVNWFRFGKTNNITCPRSVSFMFYILSFWSKDMFINYNGSIGSSIDNFTSITTLYDLVNKKSSLARNILQITEKELNQIYIQNDINARLENKNIWHLTYFLTNRMSDIFSSFEGLFKYHASLMKQNQIVKIFNVFPDERLISHVEFHMYLLVVLFKIYKYIIDELFLLNSKLYVALHINFGTVYPHFLSHMLSSMILKITNFPRHDYISLETEGSYFASSFFNRFKFDINVLMTPDYFAFLDKMVFLHSCLLYKMDKIRSYSTVSNCKTLLKKCQQGISKIEVSNNDLLSLSEKTAIKTIIETLDSVITSEFKLQKRYPLVTIDENNYIDINLLFLDRYKYSDTGNEFLVDKQFLVDFQQPMSVMFNLKLKDSKNRFDEATKLISTWFDDHHIDFMNIKLKMALVKTNHDSSIPMLVDDLLKAEKMISLYKTIERDVFFNESYNNDSLGWNLNKIKSFVGGERFKNRDGNLITFDDVEQGIRRTVDIFINSRVGMEEYTIDIDLDKIETIQEVEQYHENDSAYHKLVQDLYNGYKSVNYDLTVKKFCNKHAKNKFNALVEYKKDGVIIFDFCVNCMLFMNHPEFVHLEKIGGLDGLFHIFDTSLLKIDEIMLEMFDSTNSMKKDVSDLILLLEIIIKGNDNKKAIFNNFRNRFRSVLLETNDFFNLCFIEIENIIKIHGDKMRQLLFLLHGYSIYFNMMVIDIIDGENDKDPRLIVTEILDMPQDLLHVYDDFIWVDNEADVNLITFVFIILSFQRYLNNNVKLPLYVNNPRAPESLFVSNIINFVYKDDIMKFLNKVSNKVANY